MKNILIAFFALLLVPFANLDAQSETEQMTIDLTDPSKPGVLNLDIINGSIKIDTHNENNVVVSTSTSSLIPKDKSEESNGMKRISLNSGYDLTADVVNNEINLETSTVMQVLNFDIKVPENFSLKISTINTGNIEVKNVNGDIEVNNVNGSIDLIDVSGNAIASTINGHIIANFKTITPDTPMAFTTLTGKVDVTLPSNLKADLKVKSDLGEVYSDFDFVVKPSDKTKNITEDGVYKIIKDSWTSGTINGGGPELTLKNMHGNIYIRKGK